MTTTAPAQKIKPSAPLSEYAEFHLAFKGFSFLHIATGKTLTKLDVYYKDRKLVKTMIETRQAPSYYKLVDNPGWKNGEQIPSYINDKF